MMPELPVERWAEVADAGPWDISVQEGSWLLAIFLRKLGNDCSNPSYKVVLKPVIKHFPHCSPQENMLPSVFI